MMQAADNIYITTALLMAALPLAAFFISLFLKNDKGMSGLAIAGMALAFVGAAFLLFSGANVVASFDWLTIAPKSTIPLGIKVDPLSSVIAVVVTLVSLLVHIFSLGYMKGDPGISRYFGLLGLFTFSMLGIVFSPNLVMLFIFWELVGFSSYLLIGFWYEKPSASKAAYKAFIVNRIGDMGFLMAIGLTWAWFGTTDIDSLTASFSQWQWADGALIFDGKNISTAQLSLIGIGIFAGVVGKSALFPLLVWLPDAMEGPTPVSALIHAATMVAAGVFLLARVFVLLSPDVLMLITWIGALTALMGAIAAMRQFDIKKVLAYSTISQLGYMVVGIGVGAWFPAVLHLITHAFFKACLFLTAGSVISSLHHAAHKSGADDSFDAQDMRHMGGLRKLMPVTFACYVIAMLSLVGVPLFSGFLSKDAIILSTWHWANGQSVAAFSFYHLIPDIMLVSVAMTAFYMGRQLILVFFGESRLPFKILPKEVAGVQKWPVVVLAILSFFIFFSINPLDASSSWLHGLLMHSRLLTATTLLRIPAESILPWTVAVLSIALILTGFFFSGKRYYRKETIIIDTENTSLFSRLSLHNFYLDMIYHRIFVVPYMLGAGMVSRFDHKVVDGLINLTGITIVVFSKMMDLIDRFIVDGVVNLLANISKWVGAITRSFQGGNTQSYFLWAIVGILLVMVWLFQLIEWKITF